MKIKYKGTRFKEKYDRREMAAFVADTVNAGSKPGIPYRPNDHDDYYWTVDVGNDWKVKFFPEQPYVMEIIHRYNDMEIINALSLWIAYRTGGTV